MGDRKIGIVVDSNSQMPAELAERHGIQIVPLTVVVDGVEFSEGVDIDADSFYGFWTGDHAPRVETSQPAPGAFVAAYERLKAAGATDILSVHITESMSGTLNSARLASGMVDVPVRLVDTGTASFGISCCAWAAADAIAAGADLDTVASVAQQRAAGLHTTFVVGVPSLIDRSGRSGDVSVQEAASDGVPVLAMTGPDLSVLATVTDLDAAVQAMVDDALAWTPSSSAGLRIAVGTSNASSAPMSEALTAALVDQPSVAEVLQYRIGPSVGAHTGPGTSGLFVF
ncbi:MAG: DegV family protein [Ilumatobacter sp.]|uniref:DegV family protein n=2 Tax=Ilumatobacter sp. TaxID=1967498 RepID=UPI0032998E0F